MPPQHETMALLKELEAHNVFFDDLVDMIPAKLYIQGNSGDDQYNPKYYKGQNKESKEARRARNKAAKRAKFDPEQAETTRKVKQRLAREEEQVPSPDVSMESTEPSTPTIVSPAPSNPVSTTASSVSRIEALRAKLHAKLAERKSQRPSDPSVVSKRAARRAEKQQRKEEAKRKRASSSQVGKNDKSASNYTMPEKTDADLSADLSNLDFGKLAGLSQTPKNHVNNKSLANLNKKKNLEKMLADAEEKRQRLEQLKRGSEEEKKKAEKMMWSDTLKEARGERVKEDPAKLKKAIKRKEAKKKKSAKAWQSRMEHTKEKMDERQRIRSHNLEKRKQGGTVGANLSKKRMVDDNAAAEEEKGGSRRQSRAGFEGRKQEFLNQKGGKKKGTAQ